MLKFKKEILSTIMALVAFAGIIWGTQAYLNSNFASASEVQQLEKRLDVKILEDRLFTIQERIWKIEDRYYEITIPKDMIEQLRILNNDKDKLEKELDIIKKK